MNRNESVAFDIVLQKAKIHFVYFGKKKKYTKNGRKNNTFSCN